MNEFEIISHRQMDGISIFFDTVDYRTAHVHPEWELIWILEECLIITYGQKRFAAQPGDLVLFSPNEPHEFRRMQKSCTFLCLQISPRILPDMGRLSVDGSHPHEYLANEELQELKAAISSTAAAYLSQENNYALYCLGQCSLVLHKLLSGLPCRMLSQEEMVSIDRRNARLMRLFQFVDDNYMHKIRLQDFAAQEGCSVSYLSHFVKDSINQTFQDYVNSVRFNCACKLIAAGGMRMLDVCLESGFSDYRYFSKSFRQQFGMTPEEYSKHAAAHISQKNAVRSSLHSIERFYSRDESVALLNRFTK